jgi:hypothetical protein
MTTSALGSQAVTSRAAVRRAAAAVAWFIRLG